MNLVETREETVSRWFEGPGRSLGATGFKGAVVPSQPVHHTEYKRSLR